MSNVCACEPGTVPDTHNLFISIGTSPNALDIPEHDREPTVPATGSTGPPQPRTESPGLQNPLVN
ncbi:hypothetical protein PISMIDRAFT_686532 [Pisolithus microcarpus 441]|uniref:Uncharacterized protein n=1 Tax=Pisolithus microcarpus 441 TaxID=765257 RepID=A0A0C9XUY3_9AGAM|nr:hypothetical protein PISMIDRAFT_686532 [Pisolithus microcarpus 441]